MKKLTKIEFSEYTYSEKTKISSGLCKGYKATNLKSDKLFFIKFIPLQGSHEDRLTLLSKYIAIYEALPHHDNILTPTSYYIDNANFIVIYPYYPLTLGHILKSKTKQTSAYYNLIFKKIALAVDTLHKNNIAHLDIKPGNVLIDQLTGEPFITDYNISQFLDDTSAKPLAFTIAYASPEQRGKNKLKDLRFVDIWQLGLIYLDLLSIEFDVPNLDTEVKEYFSFIQKQKEHYLNNHTINSFIKACFELLSVTDNRSENFEKLLVFITNELPKDDNIFNKIELDLNLKELDNNTTITSGITLTFPRTVRFDTTIVMHQEFKEINCSICSIGNEIFFLKGEDYKNRTVLFQDNFDTFPLSAAANSKYLVLTENNKSKLTGGDISIFIFDLKGNYLRKFNRSYFGFRKDKHISIYDNSLSFFHLKDNKYLNTDGVFKKDKFSYYSWKEANKTLGLLTNKEYYLFLNIDKSSSYKEIQFSINTSLCILTDTDGFMNIFIVNSFLDYKTIYQANNKVAEWILDIPIDNKDLELLKTAAENHLKT
jgi:serine/threonine protein kinase